MVKPKKKKAKASPNPPRDAMVVDLRSKGYTYDAIAAKLFEAGLTDSVVSRVRVHALLRKNAPHLMGSAKRRSGQIVRKEKDANA